MSRTLYLAATLAALALITGCGDTVDSPSPVDGSTDTGNDTQTMTSLLTIAMGNVSGHVIVIDVGKADASTVYDGQLVERQRVELVVEISTYSITFDVDGFEPWSVSVPVNEIESEVVLPDEEELEPEEVEMDYSWLARTWTCLNVADPTGHHFDVDCIVESNDLLCYGFMALSLAPEQEEGKVLVLHPDIPGFDCTDNPIDYYECR